MFPRNRPISACEANGHLPTRIDTAFEFTFCAGAIVAAVSRSEWFHKLLAPAFGLLFAVKRERIVRAQKLICETSRSFIEIALEVGYTSPSHFAKVFRRVVGVTPTEFRNAL
jgi:AraC family transcriptional regulator